MRTELKPGDIVTWTSQAGGCDKTKTGEVIALIPAGEYMYKHLPANVSRSRVMAQNTSLIDRVLVAVERGQDYDWYAPRPGQVRVVGEEGHGEPGADYIEALQPFARASEVRSSPDGQDVAIIVKAADIRRAQELIDAVR